MRDARHLRQRLESALAVVQQAKADMHRDIVQGAGAGNADPERWADRLERVDEEAEKRIGELHRLRRRLHDLDEELLAARVALVGTESEPPSARTQYIGTSRVTVSRKSGYWRWPASSNARHIRPCVMPATHIAST